MRTRTYYQVIYEFDSRHEWHERELYLAVSNFITYAMNKEESEDMKIRVAREMIKSLPSPIPDQLSIKRMTVTEESKYFPL